MQVDSHIYKTFKVLELTSFLDITENHFCVVFNSTIPWHIHMVLMWSAEDCVCQISNIYYLIRLVNFHKEAPSTHPHPQGHSDCFPIWHFLTVSSGLKIALPGCRSWGGTVYANPSSGRATMNDQGSEHRTNDCKLRPLYRAMWSLFVARL